VAHLYLFLNDGKGKENDKNAYTQVLSFHSSQVLPSGCSKEFIIKALCMLHISQLNQQYMKEGKKMKKKRVKVQAVGSNDMVFITPASNWYW
jgi:hypothetical protein